jgi:hypothetical protein
MADFSGKNVLVASIGGLLLWSGVKGIKVSEAIRSVLQGKDPGNLPVANPLDAASGGSGSATGITNVQLGGDEKKNLALGRMLAASYGWVGQQFNDLVTLWNGESGWNRFAKNPSSGAYGIAQALPPTKYPFAGQEAGGSHAGTQIAWGLAYIKQRYGTPSQALAFKQAHGWY